MLSIHNTGQTNGHGIAEKDDEGHKAKGEESKDLISEDVKTWFWIFDDMHVHIYRRIECVKIWHRGNWPGLCDRYKHLKGHMDLSSNSSSRIWQ